MRQAIRTRGFTLIELLVAISVVALLIGLVLPAIQQVRESARKAQCESRLHQLAIAVTDYESSHHVFPPGAFVMGPAFPTQSGWGWVSMSLPYLEQKPLWDRIDFNHHNAQHENRDVIAILLPFTTCPSDNTPERITVTDENQVPVEIAAGSYVASGGVMSAMSKMRYATITDGVSSTLFVGERVYQPRPPGGFEGTASWSGMISFDESYIFDSTPFRDAGKRSQINSGVAFASRHPGGAQFAFGDARVRLLSESIDLNVFTALGTPDGGEPTGY